MIALDEIKFKLRENLHPEKENKINSKRHENVQTVSSQSVIFFSIIFRTFPQYVCVVFKQWQMATLLLWSHICYGIILTTGPL